MSRLDKGLDYIRPAVGRTEYVYWTSGPVPAGSPAYAINKPVPPIERVIENGMFCAALGNLIRRVGGKRIPTLGNPLYDGGTVAWWDYFAGHRQKFDIDKDYPHGTLVLRKFRDSRDQGHLAMVLADGHVLQAIDFGGGKPGLNRRYTLEESHAGWYYEAAILPEHWINFRGNEF